MKTLLLILFSTNVFSGEVHWITNTGIIEKKDCILNGFSNSDKYNYSEYYVSCKDNNIEQINIKAKRLSSVYFGNPYNSITCVVDSLAFGSSESFYILLDCRSKLTVAKDV